MQNLTCQNCTKDFLIDTDDLSFYERINVPIPTKCSTCRQQLRMLYRNFKTLYKRPSSLSGKSIITMYAPDVPFPVYSISEWWEDTWDGFTYGQDIYMIITNFIKKIIFKNLASSASSYFQGASKPPQEVIKTASLDRMKS